MLFQSVIGQSELKRRLTQTVREGRMAHAQLFWGNEGCGALPLALALAQYIQCPNRTEQDACGVCPACNKMQKLIHPDVHFVTPVNSTKEVPSDKKPVTEHFVGQWREALSGNPYLTEQEWYKTLGIDNKQGNISVHEASQIITKLNYKPFESEYKIMIIWLPERMNREAANRLLKLIEEPPDKTLFFLVSEDIMRIIATIRSRAQPVRVPPIEEDALSKKLQEQFSLPEAHACKLARAAAGSYSEALRLVQGEKETDEHFERFATLMRTAYAVEGLALMSWAEDAAKWGREQQKSFLMYAERLIRESFMFNRQAGDIVYLLSEEETFAKKFAPFVNERNLADIYHAFNTAIAHLAQNGNPKILFTDLAMQMTRLVRKV
ncbi:MAG: DNA polymerase III subunit delta' [Prevotellaceae bacterium]|jgi:DNA polymerase-3 subunit delta'|nr:DNA polymerase III subunit delta' [Prevotellaceae bacterium]